MAKNKLSNKDKKMIRELLAYQVENMIVGIADKYNYLYKDYEHIIAANPDNWDKIVSEYCYKICGV